MARTLNISKTVICSSIAAGILLLLFFVLGGLHLFGKHSPGEKIHLRYSFTLQNTESHPITNAKINIFAPVQNTSTQKMHITTASHPFTVLDDKVGNQSLSFQWDLFPPFTSKVITVNSEVLVWKKYRKIKNIQLEDYLQPEPNIESDAVSIKTLARKLTRKTSLQTVRNIFNWVAHNITYTGYTKRSRGALYALKHRKGDCTEYAHLFAALCRASGIPARCMGGFVCKKSMLLDLADYHNWAEFYLKDGWQIADPQRKIFMDSASGYIAFQIIQSSTSSTGGLVQKINGQGLKLKKRK